MYLYECLSCYGRWGSEQLHYDGSDDLTLWKFCPMCGTPWKGFKKTVDKYDDPRRTDNQEWAPTTTKVWVLSKLEYINGSYYPEEWQQVMRSSRRWVVSAQRAYAVLKWYRKQEEEARARCADDGWEGLYHDFKMELVDIGDGYVPYPHVGIR
jgi:hypothetical protein